MSDLSYMVQSSYGGDFNAEPVEEGLEVQIDGGQDAVGYTILSWASTEALYKWLGEVLREHEEGS